MTKILSLGFMFSLASARVFLNTTNPQQLPDSVLALARSSANYVSSSAQVQKITPGESSSSQLKIQVDSLPRESAWLWLSPDRADLNFQLGMLKAFEQKGLRWDGLASAGPALRYYYQWTQGLNADSIWAWKERFGQFTQQQNHKSVLQESAVLWNWNWQDRRTPLKVNDLWQDQLALLQSSGSKMPLEQLLYNYANTQWQWMGVQNSNLYYSQSPNLVKDSLGLWNLPAQIWPESLQWPEGRVYLQILGSRAGDLDSNPSKAWAQSRSTLPLQIMLPRREMASAQLEFDQGYAFGLDQVIWIQRSMKMPALDSTPRKTQPLGRWIWRADPQLGDWWLPSLPVLEHFSDLEILIQKAKQHPNIVQAGLEIESNQALVLKAQSADLYQAQMGLQGVFVQDLHAYGSAQMRTLSPQALGAHLETWLGPRVQKFQAMGFAEGIASQPVRTEILYQQGLSEQASRSLSWTQDLLQKDWNLWSFKAMDLKGTWEFGLQRSTTLLQTTQSQTSRLWPKLEEVAFGSQQHVNVGPTHLHLKQWAHSASYQRYNVNGAPLNLMLQADWSWKYQGSKLLIEPKISTGADLSYAKLSREGTWSFAETLMADSAQIDTVANLVQSMKWPVEEFFGPNPLLSSKGYALLGMNAQLNLYGPWSLGLALNSGPSRRLFAPTLWIHQIQAKCGVQIWQTQIQALWQLQGSQHIWDSRLGIFIGGPL